MSASNTPWFIPDRLTIYMRVSGASFERRIVLRHAQVAAHEEQRWGVVLVPERAEEIAHELLRDAGVQFQTRRDGVYRARDLLMAECIGHARALLDAAQQSPGTPHGLECVRQASDAIDRLSVALRGEHAAPAPTTDPAATTPAEIPAVPGSEYCETLGELERRAKGCHEGSAR